MSRLLGLACTLALAACTGSLFKDQAVPPSVYLLSASAGTPGAQIPADLAVLKPRIRVGLESDRVSVLYPDRRLDYFAGARWSGPLDEVIHDLAVQTFLTHANLRNVSGDASAFTHGYWLEIVVLDFQAEYPSAEIAPTIHVHFLGQLGTSGDRRILGRFEASSRQAAADNRLTAIIAAYEQAADAALAEIVSESTAVIEESLGRR
jgi:cholesterol transport system auxiliary component